MNRFKIVLSIIFVLFLFFACKEKPKNPVAEYGDALIDSYKRGQNAGEKANLDALKKAVESYRATNGRLPENMEEMKEFIGSGIDTSKYDYNSENGAVSLKK
jgi:hypothetical protein